MIIVNDKMKESLFDQSDAVGKVVAVDGKPFTVIGVYHPLANFFSNNDKPGAIIPFETGAPQAAVRACAGSISR